MGVISWMNKFISATTPKFDGTFAVYRVFMNICGLNFFDDNFMVGPVNCCRFLGPYLAGFYTVLACLIHMIRNLGDVDSTILSISTLFSAFEVLIKIGRMAVKRRKGIELMQIVLSDRSYTEGSFEWDVFLKYNSLAR